MPHCYVISTLPVLLRARLEVLIVKTMKTAVSWYATNVARLMDTDAASDHSAFITCLLSAHRITSRRPNLNSSSHQNQKLRKIVTLCLFGLSWSRRCCICKLIYTLSGLV
jgi:hypothetical protein